MRDIASSSPDIYAKPANSGRSAALPVMSGSKDEGGNDDSDSEVGIATKTRAKPKKPSQYKVLMLNDDYTPMEFVVLVEIGVNAHIAT